VTGLAQASYNYSTFYPALGAFFNINLATPQPHWSWIKYGYTSAQVAAKGWTGQESKFRLAFYNTATSAWQFVSNQQYSVDVNAQVVAQATTSFSQWGVFYDSSSSSAISRCGVNLLLLGVLILSALSN